MQVDVYISHAGEDNFVAAKLGSALKEHGIDVWVDFGPILSGKTTYSDVVKAMNSSRIVLALCSKAIERPVWVQGEATAYRTELYDRRGLVVIPVRIEPCQLPYSISTRASFDLFRGDFEKRVEELANYLMGILSRRLIFVSHSHLDKEIVGKVVRRLRRRKNLELWYDEQSLGPGNIIRRGIETGIARADYMIAILSKNVIDTIDGWIGFELDQAYEIERERNKKGHYFAIPVLIEQNISIPGWLSTKVYVDLTKDFDAGIEKLVHAVSQKPKD